VAEHEDVEICIWTYYVKPEKEDAFRTVLEQNWPTLRRLEFVTDDPPQVLRSTDDPPVYVEIVNWRRGATVPAHLHPDVIPIWETMKTLVEERPEQIDVPGMRYPLFRPVQMPW
jgi:hypothetical protein